MAGRPPPRTAVIDTSRSTTWPNGEMKRVQFAVRYPEFVHPLQRQVVAETPLTRTELLMWSPTADATSLCWLDVDRDAAAAATEAIDSLLASHFVEGADGTYAFLQQDDYEFSAAILETIVDARVIFLPPVVFLDTGAVRFEAVGEPTALSTFHERLSALGTLSIERVHEFERRAAPSRLTDRQRAALAAAVDCGYYEVPREGSVADVAAALECSSSTAGELLRKAEAAVVKQHTERQ